MYDEEVTDTKEMYFSDDEEERNMKRGKKKKNQRNNNSNCDNRYDANCVSIANSGRMNTMQPQKYRQQQYQQFTHNIDHRQGTSLTNHIPLLQQHQHQYSAYTPQNTYNAPPPGPPGTLNYSTYARPPIQPPLGVLNNVPPPPPPPPPLLQPYNNANTVTVHQMNNIHHSAPQNQSQAYYQQPQQQCPQPYYQQQQYQHQPSQHDQGNSNSNQKNSDTVYYNYS